jgi:uncharacterized protein (DUF1697 family)
MTVFVALLHSISLNGGRRLVMADFRRLAEEVGLKTPRTLIATGNLVFQASRAAAAGLETRLEHAFEEAFGRHVDIIIRNAPRWRRMLDGNPFPSESASDASRVVVRVSRTAIDQTLAAVLADRATQGERMAIVDGDLWVYFPHGPARSRLLAALTTKRLGVGTIRNWNTLRRLDEMAGL